MNRPGSFPTGLLLRWLVSVGLVLGLVLWLEPTRTLPPLNQLSAGWLIPALLLVIPQVVISAWRWRLTARYLGLSLSMPRAVSEYWLAGFLNQLLPGGVAGDAARAWRHGKRGALPAEAAHEISTQRGRALRAVIIERASGQLALLLVAVTAMALSTSLQPLLARIINGLLALDDQPLSLRLALTLVLLGLPVIAARLLRRFPPHWLRQLLCDIRSSWGAPQLWLGQLSSSLLVVATYIGVFCCTARALQLPLPLATLIPLAALVLMAMAIPLSIAGWGIREGAAALVWSLAGLPAEQGMTLSMTYGVVTLLSALPGALVLLTGFRAKAATTSPPAVSHTLARRDFHG
ncbi:uncharacterized protein (TIRG00374 family) [Kushneria sinocarnis]|uniref:Uncharacterized protein (TIRG00374 family) n=1 Tax=Kushneria sinocarnis TaxID=595502 RepID=A0A420WV28_9GAMM|nr:lysylphosphatidylglycerol synthase transmembrane domain-containing protein [Kushneria sinocarnis]RKR02417.1 uncharacterized protein (TIRG00374 family) [Kushneria sinocarnis]